MKNKIGGKAGFFGLALKIVLTAKNCCEKNIIFKVNDKYLSDCSHREKLQSNERKKLYASDNIIFTGSDILTTSIVSQETTFLIGKANKVGLISNFI